MQVYWHVMSIFEEVFTTWSYKGFDAQPWLFLQQTSSASKKHLYNQSYNLHPQSDFNVTSLLMGTTRALHWNISEQSMFEQ